MSRVKSRDTKPELRVRKLIHGLGYRYRLHGKELPGKPDLVFASRRKVIFIHGCFWHRHEGCARNRTPKSPERREFWESKLGNNVARDKRNLRELRKLGWSVLILWECQSEKPDRLTQRILRFLGKH